MNYFPSIISMPLLLSFCEITKHHLVILYQQEMKFVIFVSSAKYSEMLLLSLSISELLACIRLYFSRPLICI